MDFALEVEKVSTEPVGKEKIILNIDGMLGIIAAALGFRVEQVDAIFIGSRTNGLCANYVDNMSQGMVRLNDEHVDFSGCTPERDLPTDLINFFI